jgi:histidinol-phosphate aminotransferase
MDAARAVAIPLSVTEPAQRAAIVSLEHEPELMVRVAKLNERRAAIVAGLESQGWNVPPPQGNFVWLEIGQGTAAAADVLARHGLVVRALGEGVRVSVGEHESVDKLLSATAELVGMRPTGLRAGRLD